MIEDADENRKYITVIYQLYSSSALKYLRTADEVTTICTPFENILICGTTLGSINVFDLNEEVRNEDINLGDEVNNNLEMEALRRHYKLLTPTFITDGLDNVVHYFPISKLVSLVKKGSHRVVAIDSVGKMSTWIMIEYSEGDWAGSLADITLKEGGRIKLALHSEIDLAKKLDIVYDPDTFEIDFNPSDHNSFFFSTSDGLHFSRLFNQSDESISSDQGPIVKRIDTSNLGSLIRCTSLSYSDRGYVLAGFEDGSIGLYHSDFTSQICMWYQS